jgi:hypothetical protein
MATRTNTLCVSWSHDTTRSGVVSLRSGVAGGEDATGFGFGGEATFGGDATASGCSRAARGEEGGGGGRAGLARREGPAAREPEQRTITRGHQARGTRSTARVRLPSFRLFCAFAFWRGIITPCVFRVRYSKPALNAHRAARPPGQRDLSPRSPRVTFEWRVRRADAMKAVSPNVMPKGGEPRVPGPADVAGVKSNASVFAQRHKETRPAWLEACELARRAGDDLERLADRLAGVTGTCGGRCSRRSSVANREDARSRRVPFRDGLVSPSPNRIVAFLGRD